MSERRLQRQCRRLLRELDVAPPFDITEFCGRLAGQRGRPIVLRPYPVPVPGPSGVWIATAAADLIVYQQETSRLHQVHIILHEVGHLIADHTSDGGDDTARTLSPYVTPDAARRWLRLGSHGTAQETEAEIIATIITEWAWALGARAPRLPRTEAGRRLRGGLSDHAGWM